MKGFIAAGLVLIVSFAVPVFATHFYGNGHAQNVIVKQKIVEFDNRDYLGLDGYFRVGDQLDNRYPIYVDDNNQLEQNLGEKLDKVIEKLDGTNIRIETLLKILAGEDATIPEPKPESGPVENEVGEPTDVSEIDAKVYDLVALKCAKCHNEKNDGGGLVMMKGDVLQRPPLAMMDLIVHLTEATDLKEGEVRMPKGSGPLTDDELKTFKDWRYDEMMFLLRG